MSAVIIIGLVVMWAVVLIPMWLRRHDEHEESRSVDRFTTAMHTLSRREARQAREAKPSVAAERYGLMPRQVRNVEVHVSGASAARRARESRESREPKAPLTAAQRRRRTLTALLLVTVVFFVAAVATMNLILWTVQILADLAVLAFVVHLRRMAIASAAARRRRPAPRRAVADDPVIARPAPEPLAVPDRYEQPYEDDHSYEQEPRVTVRRYASEREVAREATYDQPAYDQYDAYEAYDEYEADAEPLAAVFDRTALADESWSEPAEAIFDQEVEPAPVAEPRRSFIEAGAQPGRRAAEPDRAEPQYAPRQSAQTRYAEPEAARAEPQAPAAAGAGSTWEPVPVPRPTYTMKPAAPPRRRRRVEIDEPLLPPVETAAEMDTADDLEEILDRRWAVND